MGLRANIIINSQLYPRMPDFIKGDYGMKLNFEVKNDDGSVHALTGETAKFKMKQINETSLKVDASATIDSEPNGQCSYTIASANFDTAGVFDAELEITKSSTSVRTVNLGRFRITPDL